MEEGMVPLNGITLITSRFSSIILSKLDIVLCECDDDADVAYPKYPIDNTTIKRLKKSAL
jgi:hypothetical protein